MPCSIILMLLVVVVLALYCVYSAPSVQEEARQMQNSMLVLDTTLQAQDVDGHWVFRIAGYPASFTQSRTVPPSLVLLPIESRQAPQTVRGDIQPRTAATSKDALSHSRSVSQRVLTAASLAAQRNIRLGQQEPEALNATLLVAALVAILAMALVGKRTWQTWESGRQKGALAHEIEYAASIGYGSFVSDWSGDYFDKFDL
jgi:hypothetical protein